MQLDVLIYPTTLTALEIEDVLVDNPHTRQVDLTADLDAR